MNLAYYVVRRFPEGKSERIRLAITAQPRRQSNRSATYKSPQRGKNNLSPEKVKAQSGVHTSHSVQGQKANCR